MFTMPTKPQNAFRVLLSGLKFWGSHWGQLCLVTVVAMALGSLPGFFFPELNSFDAKITTQFVEEHIVFVFLFGIIMFFIFGFIVHRVHSLMYETKASVGASVWMAIKRLPILIAALVIYDIVVLAGFMLFIIPGVAFSILLSLYFVLIMTDNLGPLSAFKESWHLVTDDWFHSFVVLTIMTIVLVSLSLLVKMGTRDIWVIVHPAGYGVLDLGNRILRIVSGMLFYGVFVSILLMLCHDLKLRKAQS